MMCAFITCILVTIKKYKWLHFHLFIVTIFKTRPSTGSEWIKRLCNNLCTYEQKINEKAKILYYFTYKMLCLAVNHFLLYIQKIWFLVARHSGFALTKSLNFHGRRSTISIFSLFYNENGKHHCSAHSINETFKSKNLIKTFWIIKQHWNQSKSLPKENPFLILKSTQ